MTTPEIRDTKLDNWHRAYRLFRKLRKLTNRFQEESDRTRAESDELAEALTMMERAIHFTERELAKRRL